MAEHKVNPKDITAKNTKSEILETYEAVLKQARELYKKNRQQQRELEAKDALIAKAKEQSRSTSSQNILSLRKQINDQLTEINEQMSSQVQQLERLDKAIKEEENILEEMYEIKKSAHTLDALLLSHKQEKMLFDQEMNEKREAWKDEQEQVRKEWQREQQEYHYKLKMARLKDEDEYNVRKLKQEADLKHQKELVEADLKKRNEVLLVKEKEFSDMQERIKEFPSALEKAVSDAEAEITKRLNREHKFQFDLLEKERHGERSLSEQAIASLEGKVKSQELLINELNGKINGSAKQVQDIAVKAIEGAAATNRNFYLNADNPKEREKI